MKCMTSGILRTAVQAFIGRIWTRMARIGRLKNMPGGGSHPLAECQFKADLDALEWADACVLVLPCGRSAHTEAGWMAGRGRKVVVYIPEMQEPELMYKLFDKVVGSLDDLTESLKR